LMRGSRGPLSKINRQIRPMPLRIERQFRYPWAQRLVPGFAEKRRMLWEPW
jgi:hypothetical protein